MFRLLKYVASAILILLASFFLFTLFICHFLSVNKPVNSRTLVIEGWISPLALEGLADTLNPDNFDHIIITGVRKPPYNKTFVYDQRKQTDTIHPALLIKKSILIVPISNREETITTISIYASTDSITDTEPHYVLFLDSLILGGCFVNQKITESVFHVNLYNAENANLVIFYDNDIFIREKDRNMIIHGISVNNQYMPIYSSGLINTKQEFPFPQHAILQSSAFATLNYLKELGLSSENMIALAYNKNSHNKTLGSVEEFKNWADHHLTDENFNIISLGIHARRSWLTYKKVMGPSFDVGIISPIDPDFYSVYYWKKQNTIEEVYKEFFTYLYVKYFMK